MAHHSITPILHYSKDSYFFKVLLDAYPFRFLLGSCASNYSIGYVMKFFLSVLGMVMILEGFPYFVFPEGIKRWLVKVSEMEATHLRTFGLIAMCAGMALVYLGQRSNLF